MRILLSKESREYLFNYLKQKEKCVSLKDLSISQNIPLRTLQNWLYQKERYIPEKFIPSKIMSKLDIIDQQKDNWGRVKGGKKTYEIIIKKYGLEEMNRRRSIGGRKAADVAKSNTRNSVLKMNFLDPSFLEFYGVLLGDGWIGRYKYKNKNTKLIGITGHLKNDKEFFIYLKDKINLLFNRKAYIKERHKYNAADLTFSHEGLFNKLSKDFKFPIGKKKNLQLPSNLKDLNYSQVKYIIRGMFDTDGSFYYDKTPVGKPYPCISITMKQPILMQQVHSFLIKEGFKAYHYKTKPIEKIILKGSIQLKKWMEEIGSSNPYKLAKMQKARVAQPG